MISRINENTYFFDTTEDGIEPRNSPIVQSWISSGAVTDWPKQKRIETHRHNVFALVVMGVSGTGKSTIGSRLAEVLSCPFIEGDSLHSNQNIEMMSRGVALADDDRWPWLDEIGSQTRRELHNHGICVSSCSALKRVYRDRLRECIKHPVGFVHLEASKDELHTRIRSRETHFMPVTLLDSQIALLERPDWTEISETFETMRPVTELVENIYEWVCKYFRHEDNRAVGN